MSKGRAPEMEEVDERERKEIETFTRRLMIAVFLHAKISTGRFGVMDNEVKFARELANAAMKEPKG